MYALPAQTMIADPECEIYAVDGKQEKMLQNLFVTKMQAMEEGCPEIHIMKYDIGLISKGDCVDPITLIKSLKEKDDRIEIAIKEMMEREDWYET